MFDIFNIRKVLALQAELKATVMLNTDLKLFNTHFLDGLLKQNNEQADMIKRLRTRLAALMEVRPDITTTNGSHVGPTATEVWRKTMEGGY